VSIPLKVHRSIDRIPAEVRKAAERMILADAWPKDFRRTGRPTYADVGRFLHDRGFRMSKSAIGRWGRKLLQAKYGKAGR
jgi:hypothetical protein